MAKDKIEVEIEPTVSPTGLAKLRRDLASAGSQAVSGAGLAASAGGIATGAGAALTTGAAASFIGIGNQMAGWVSKANPATVSRWTAALDDASAVIGHRLTPGLEFFTGIVRTVGDAFATDSKSAALFKETWDSLRETFERAKPLIADASHAFIQFVGHVLKGTSDLLEYAKPGFEWLHAKTTEARAQLKGDAFIENAAGIAARVGTLGKEGAAASFERAERLEGLQKKFERGQALTENEDKARQIYNRIHELQGADKDKARAEMDRLLAGGGESIGARSMRASTIGGQDISSQLIIGALEAGTDPARQTADNTRRTAQLLEQLVERPEAARGGGVNAPAANQRGTLPRTA